MIVLDTNTVSELMAPRPAEQVLAWFDRQPRGHLATTAMTAWELRMGVRSLPLGRRREKLHTSVEAALGRFSGRILAFDDDAGVAAAGFSARRRQAGRPVAVGDILIAGIALANRCALATRNRSHFEDQLLTLINPWDQG